MPRSHPHRPPTPHTPPPPPPNAPSPLPRPCLPPPAVLRPRYAAGRHPRGPVPRADAQRGQVRGPRGAGGGADGRRVRGAAPAHAGPGARGHQGGARWLVGGAIGLCGCVCLGGARYCPLDMWGVGGGGWGAIHVVWVGADTGQGGGVPQRSGPPLHSTPVPFKPLPSHPTPSPSPLTCSWRMSSSSLTPRGHWALSPRQGGGDDGEGVWRAARAAHVGWGGALESGGGCGHLKTHALLACPIPTRALLIACALAACLQVAGPGLAKILLDLTSPF